MSRPIDLLLISDDPDLRAEWQATESGLTDMRVRAQFADRQREALELARTLHPDVVCLTNQSTMAEFRELVDEIRQVLPSTPLVGVLDRRRFESAEAESTFIIEATRAGLSDFLRRPVSSTELAVCMRRILNKPQVGAESAARSGRIIPVTSNKGGVGKTTVSVNLACELARQAPGRVLLVDAAIQLGLCATMLDLEETVTMHDAVAQIDRLDPMLLRELTVAHRCGLDLLAAPGNAIEAAAVTEQHVSRILAIARLAYDFVIVDTFPILDGIAIAAFDRADEVLQVVAPTVPTVLGAERFIGLLEGVGVEAERQRIIVNTSVPSHSGRLSAQDVATRLGRHIDLVIPFTRAAVTACNSGEPVVLTAPRWSGFRRRMSELAELVSEPQLAGMEAEE